MTLVILHHSPDDSLASQLADKFPTVRWYRDLRMAMTILRRDVPDLIVAEPGFASVRKALDPFVASKFVVLTTFTRQSILDAYDRLES